MGGGGDQPAPGLPPSPTTTSHRPSAPGSLGSLPKPFLSRSGVDRKRRATCATFAALPEEERGEDHPLAVNYGCHYPHSMRPSVTGEEDLRRSVEEDGGSSNKSSSKSKGQ